MRLRSRVDRTKLRSISLAVPDWLAVLTVCLVPIGIMLVRSLGRVSSVTLEVEQVWTLDAYRDLLSGTYRPVLVRSVALAAMTVGMAVAIGTPAALALSRLSAARRNLMLAAVMLPSFVNFTVRIFAWQGVLATGGPVESVTGLQLIFRTPAVVIGMITAYVPLFILPAYVALARIPASLLEASADLGARRGRQLFTVTLPLAMPGLVTGAVVVGVLSLGEFIVPSVLGGGKVLLLGNILVERGAGRDQPLGGAITAVMLATFAIGALVVLWFRRRAATHELVRP